MRSRAYVREMRQKHIRRKKRITAHYPSGTSYYRFDGMYSKGKIHCSCPLCSEKALTRGHNPTVQEKRRMGRKRRFYSVYADEDGFRIK